MSGIGRSPGYSPTASMMAKSALGPSPLNLNRHSPAYSPTSVSKYQYSHFISNLFFFACRRKSCKRRWYHCLQPNARRNQSSRRPLALPSNSRESRSFASKSRHFSKSRLFFASSSRTTWCLSRLQSNISILPRWLAWWKSDVSGPRLAAASPIEARRCLLPSESSLQSKPQER